ncbi:MAG: hypothetical protein KKH61_00030, partial [Gammaproteobacteria bacterium]|nr:hypothetical protein [Gammaproteobacteria bacterium]
GTGGTASLWSSLIILPVVWLAAAKGRRFIAYAGIGTDALAGRGRSAAATVPLPSSAPRRAAPRADRGIEIIRGDISSHSGSR